MIKNYLKIAFRVMLRQKFITSIILFGIAFTIMAFTISIAIANLTFGNNYPATNRDRSLYFEGFAFSKNGRDLVNIITPRTVFNDIKKMQSVERICTYSIGTISFFKNKRKTLLNAVFTDEKLWEVYAFKFLEGKPYTEKQAEEGHSLAVITESVKRHYFGEESAVGKFIDANPKLKVIGVVEDYISVKGAPDTESSNIFIPLNRHRLEADSVPKQSYAIILAKRKTDILSIKQQLADLINKQYNPKGDELILYANTIYEKMDYQNFLNFLVIFIVLIMIIPALNLIGLNINRISERSSEIGIRKAFGASTSELVTQFVTENLVTTFLGGILGIALTYLASGIVVSMLYINQDIIPKANFVVNPMVIFTYSLGASVVFGFLSGVYPAWRMAKLQIIKAIKVDSL